VTETLPREFWQGVEQFNQQEFYACHDILEALWMEAMEPLRTFYQGVLQIAVALYHLSNHNWRGSVILLGEGINRLRPYQPIYADVDVAQFLTQSAELLTILQQMGPERVMEVAQTVIQIKGNGNSDTANIPVKSIKISRYSPPSNV
jgi:uncharacterized protein